MTTPRLSASSHGSRRGSVRVVVAFLLAALGFVLPVVRSAHDGAHERQAKLIEAACPDGCADPSHHHQSHDSCVLCSSHAVQALRPALILFESPRTAPACAVEARGSRWSAELLDSSVPRGPPPSIVA